MNNSQKTPESRQPTAEARELYNEYLWVVDKNIENFDRAMGAYPVAQTVERPTDDTQQVFASDSIMDGLRQNVDRAFDHA